MKTATHKKKHQGHTMFYVETPTPETESQQHNTRGFASHSSSGLRTTKIRSDSRSSPSNSPKITTEMEEAAAEEAEEIEESLFPRCTSSKFTLFAS